MVVLHLEFHPFTQFIPRMTKQEKARLYADIERNGQRVAIVLFEGMILDGRERYEVCRSLARNPTDEKFNGSRDEARLFCVEQALIRSNYTASQQAMHVALSDKVALQRKNRIMEGQLTVAEASKHFGVDLGTLYKALFIRSNDSELTQQVLAGTLCVSKAYEKVKEKSQDA